MTAWQQQLLHNKKKIGKLLFRKKYILLIHFVYIFFHEIVSENTVCVSNLLVYLLGELRLLTKKITYSQTSTISLILHMANYSESMGISFFFQLLPYLWV